MPRSRKLAPQPVRRVLTQWNRLADRELKSMVGIAQGIPGLRKLARSTGEWAVDVKLLGSSAMARLNAKYRGKDVETDVLSFPSPLPFRRAGHLGELVICLPVLKRQAKEAGHSEVQELRVLLAHGLLHLLGFDHELGPKQAGVMHKWEERLLNFPGLIARSR